MKRLILPMVGLLSALWATFSIARTQPRRGRHRASGPAAGLGIRKHGRRGRPRRSQHREHLRRLAARGRRRESLRHRRPDGEAGRPAVRARLPPPEGRPGHEAAGPGRDQGPGRRRPRAQGRPAAPARVRRAGEGHARDQPGGAHAAKLGRGDRGSRAPGTRSPGPVGRVPAPRHGGRAGAQHRPLPDRRRSPAGEGARGRVRPAAATRHRSCFSAG